MKQTLYDNEWLSRNKAAELLGITFYRMTKMHGRGTGPPCYPGGGLGGGEYRYNYLVKDLKAWVDGALKEIVHEVRPGWDGDVFSETKKSPPRELAGSEAPLETVGYLAQTLGIHIAQGYALIRNGVIEAPVVVKIGRQYRINPGELDLWIAAGGAAYPGGRRKANQDESFGFTEDELRVARALRGFE